ncbi:O-antigen ligase family protein [Vibrio parahaemolyticus]|uniref:O-antigen ligase family protein n=1 Tax=Vibrio parahaemolyticus TaxID=670 RepID=UPI0011204DF2|nr:O-antigen ligase family protein [Vibrio parahaemolyticus]EKB1972158.1 O-antigen ligase family protein [Vibrio parahaemolyticus]MDF4591087.1 O-antigen ligase family protein [Vibrio parahaemolyticus]TOB78988.1 hypothetical protein CGK00_04485 [Vibrio parahaemolyticus]
MINSVRPSILITSILLVFFSVIDLDRIGIDFFQFYFKVICSLIFFILFFCCTFTKGSILKTKNTIIPFSYFLFAMISLFWSYDLDASIISIFGVGSILTAYLYYINNKTEKVELALAFHAASLIFILISFILTPFFTSSFYDLLQGKMRYSGLSYGAHAIARVSVMLYICTIYLYSINRIGKALLIFSVVVSFMVVYATDSRQAYVGVFVSTFLYFYFVFSMSKYKYLCYVLSAIILYLTVSLVLLGNQVSTNSLSLISRSGSIEEIWTLTGRTDIWSAVIDIILERPFTGYGFGAGSSVLEQSYSTLHGWTTGSSHNSLLHMSMELGIVISLLVHLHMVKTTILCLVKRDLFFSSILSFMIVLGLIERSFSGNVDYMFIFYLLSLSLIKNESTTRIVSVNPKYIRV